MGMFEDIAFMVENFYFDVHSLKAGRYARNRS